MFDLFVGDNNDQLRLQAISHNAQATLIHDTSTVMRGATYYTSLADTPSIEEFHKLCQQAGTIWYCPPVRWSGGDDQKKYTEIILSEQAQYKTVNGYAPRSFIKSNYLLQSRPQHDPVLFVVGDSITYASHVPDNKSWKSLCKTHFQRHVIDLSYPGSSIIWASDQICQSNIKTDDYVFWGLTTHARIPVIHDNKILHLNVSEFDKNADLSEVFPLSLLHNDSLLYHNIMAIRRVSKFCREVKAKLVILGLMYDWDLTYNFFNVKEFRQLMSWPFVYPDRGSDNLHPGIASHQFFAESFISFFNQLYDS